MSMAFSRQEYWSGLPHPPPGDLPDPGIESVSFIYPALEKGLFTMELPGKSEGKRETLQTVLFTAMQSAPCGAQMQLSLKPGECLKEF